MHIQEYMIKAISHSPIMQGDLNLITFTPFLMVIVQQSQIYFIGPAGKIFLIKGAEAQPNASSDYCLCSNPSSEQAHGDCRKEQLPFHKIKASTRTSLCICGSVQTPLYQEKEHCAKLEARCFIVLFFFWYLQIANPN